VDREEDTLSRNGGPHDGEPDVRPPGVVRLPDPGPAQDSEPPATPRPAGLHGVATAGMALCAVVAVVAGIAFLTVGWPGRSGRVVIAIMVGGVLGFLACGSAAVFVAARDTYAGHTPPEG
jgi:hypothetical protein